MPNNLFLAPSVSENIFISNNFYSAPSISGNIFCTSVYYDYSIKAIEREENDNDIRIKCCVVKSNTAVLDFFAYLAYHYFVNCEEMGCCV